MNERLIIGIAGGSGSGKTTLAEHLVKHFGDRVSLLRHDDYYKAQSSLTIEERATLNFDHPDAFDTATAVYEIKAVKNAYISKMDAEKIGLAAMKLGAGRKTKDDAIDFSAGIVLRKKTGDYACDGETLAVLYTSEEERLTAAEKIFRDSLEFSLEKTNKNKLIIDILR